MQLTKYQLIFLLLLFAVNIVGQEAPSGKVEERPPKILDALHAASLSRPEIAADLMLRLVESAKIRDREWQREILNAVDRILDDVQLPVRRKLTRTGAASVDTHSGYLSYAYDLKLDKLSLTGRLVRQFQKLDSDRARHILINTAADLKLKPLPCGDSLVYDVADIYSAVGEFAAGSFTKKDVEEGIRALFLANWIERIESPAQIAPALGLLSKFSSSPSERQLLFQALARAMDRDFADDRSFTHALEFDRPESKIASLISGSGDMHLKEELVSAFRSFLIKNLKRPRCSENLMADEQVIEAWLLRFNHLFPSKPIKVDEIAANESDGAAEIINYWQSATARKLQSDLRALRAGKPERGDTSRFDLWRSEVAQFIAGIDSWEPSTDESAAEVFNQKSVLYRVLLETVSDTPLRSDIFSRFHRFLAGSEMYSKGVAEWLFHARWLSGFDRKEFDRLSSASNNNGLRALALVNSSGSEK